MINIFIPIVENVEGFCEFVAKHKEKDKHIYVGIRKSLKEKFVITNDNVEIHIFDDKSNKEEIINGLQKCERVKGKLLLIRRPLTDDEYTALTTSESEITTLKAHHNKFVTWFKNLARKTVKKFFAFSFFEDISAICYGEFLHEFVESCPNLSIATRVNKYVGVDVEEIETTTPSVKKDYSKTKAGFKLATGCLILGGAIAGAGCIFAFVNPLRAIFVVLVLAMLFVALMVFGIFIVNYVRTVAVGNLEYKAGTEVEVLKAKISFEEERQEFRVVALDKSKKKTASTNAKTKKSATSSKAGAKKTASKSKAGASKEASVIAVDKEVVSKPTKPKTSTSAGKTATEKKQVANKAATQKSKTAKTTAKSDKTTKKVEKE